MALWRHCMAALTKHSCFGAMFLYDVTTWLLWWQSSMTSPYGCFDHKRIVSLYNFGDCSEVGTFIVLILYCIVFFRGGVQKKIFKACTIILNVHIFCVGYVHQRCHSDRLEKIPLQWPIRWKSPIKPQMVRFHLTDHLIKISKQIGDAKMILSF